MLEVLEGRNHVAVFIRPGLMPARPVGDEEGFAVGGLVLNQFRQQVRLVLEVRKVPFTKLLALAVEFIRQPFQKQQTEDELLKLRSIHLPAQDVGGFEQGGFELREGDFFGGHVGAQATLTLTSGCFSRDWRIREPILTIGWLNALFGYEPLLPRHSLSVSRSSRIDPGCCSPKDCNTSRWMRASFQYFHTLCNRKDCSLSAMSSLRNS